MTLRTGETVTAEFDGAPGLDPGVSDVKVADVIVGTVGDVDQTEQGGALVSMDVDAGVVEKLGRAPSARIRATTLLGGRHYVDLQPSGDGEVFTGETIPSERTKLPVALDDVLSAVPPPAQDGVRTTARQLDRTLEQGGTEAMQRAFDEAPEVLSPAGSVLSAAQGRRPGRDLSELVTNTNAMADVLTQHDGQLGEIVDSFAGVSSSLTSESESLAEVTRGMPDTLSSTRAGLRSLRGTLGRLTDTAGKVRPAARELEPFLRELDSVSRQARPVVNDLVPVLERARPVVDELVPTSEHATETFDNISGPVLERVRGPIMDATTSSWQGTGHYEGGGNGHKFYEELGYLAARTAHLSHYGDNNSQIIALGGGTGISGVGGTGLGLQDFLQLTGSMPVAGDEGVAEQDVAGDAVPRPDESSLPLPDGTSPLLGGEGGASE
ncbi:MlaD family protein [Haloechinothrix alba]|nr:MlaD family protein [Haloechinothrix alba]